VVPWSWQRTVQADLQHAGGQQHVERPEPAVEPLAGGRPVTLELLQGGRCVHPRVERTLQLGEGGRDLAAGHPARQLADGGPATPGAHLLAREPAGDIVVDEPAHPGQLASRGEVVDGGHVRVGGGAVPIEEVLRAFEDGRRDSNLHRLEPLAGSRDAPVTAGRRGRRGRDDDGEVSLPGVGDLGWGTARPRAKACSTWSPDRVRATTPTRRGRHGTSQRLRRSRSPPEPL